MQVEKISTCQRANLLAANAINVGNVCVGSDLNRVARCEYEVAKTECNEDAARVIAIDCQQMTSAFDCTCG